MGEYGTLRNADSKYLYRGLREEEVDAGFKLIPRGIQTFEDLKLASATTITSLDTKLENLGPILTVSDHINEYPTSGISTSTDIDVAKRYAYKSKYIVKINREKAKSLGIKEIIVKKILPLGVIKKPEDEEVILTSETGLFPSEIIEEHKKLN